MSCGDGAGISLPDLAARPKINEAAPPKPAALGYRLPPLELTRSAEVKLTKLERCAPRLIEVFLRDYEWEVVMGPFFRAASPLFEGFRDLLEAMSSDKGPTGRGFDYRMHQVHSEFLDAVMNIINEQFEEMGYTEEKFVAAMLAGFTEVSQHPAATKLAGFLDGLADFYHFGMMMEDMFGWIYGEGDGGARGLTCPFSALLRPPRAQPGHHRVLATAQHTGSGGAGEVSKRPVVTVRVLWDIENVAVSKKEGGIATICKLNSFLASIGLFGPGVDTRITAFFNPTGGAVSKHVAHDLDKAAVELVWVSSKREDADRKLGMRINQEMQVLPPVSTAFVIITSDLDFRHHFQLLRNSGYRVILLHNARPGKWEQAISMHCSESYSWVRDVMEQGASKVDGISAGLSEGSLSNKEVEHKSKKHRKKVLNSGSDSNTGSSLVIEGEWYRGACKIWKGRFGFLTVSIGDQSIDVYVKSATLPPECRGVLTAQDIVNLTIEAAEKGFRAAEVRVLEASVP